MKKSIVFLIRALDRGGAERQLVELAKGLVRRGHDVAVAVFYGHSVYGRELAEAGVRVFDLGKKGRWDVLPFLYRLIRVLHRERPAILHSYLDLPNILASLLKPLLRGTQIVWGVRASNLDLGRYQWPSRLAYALECHLARFADVIIANSRAGKQYAIENGFPAGKTIVIPNGIDTEYFCYSPEGRFSVRSDWGIAEDEILIGIAARIDPMKDHQTFIKAAAQVARAYPYARFVCVGGGDSALAATLRLQANELGLTEKLLWVGSRGDMPKIYSALDIAVSSSSCGEGFSNSIAEAMACGVPAVVTDIGDSSHIVGETGRIVIAGDAQALADAIAYFAGMLPHERRKMGEMARLRVVSEFHVDHLIQRSEMALGLI